MKKFKTSQLTLGAILLAVFLILHLIIPGGQKSIQGMLLVITFLPATIYCIRCGVRKTLVMIGAGLILSGLLLPLEVFLAFAAPALLIGLVAGLTYGKLHRLPVILILSVMFLLQNIGELLIYYLMMQVDLVDTYIRMVGLVHDNIPDVLMAMPVFRLFLEDFLLCAVPCMAILVSGAKGILSFMILTLLHTRLSSILGSEADPELTKQTKFNGVGISVAYFCTICICAVMTALPFLSIMPYYFVNAAFAALGVLLAILYTYYFYTVRIRTQENQTRIIYSFLTVITLPIGIFVLPLLEIKLLKAEKKEQPKD